MLPTWSRKWTKKFFATRPSPYVKPLHWKLVNFLELEDRVTPATITWDGGAGTLNWGDAKNWSSDVAPGANDDVVIPDLGTLGIVDKTITFSGGVTVKSLTNAEIISIASGTLTNAGNLSGSGSVSVGGGTLAFSGTNWTNTSTIKLTSGTLNLGGSFTQVSLGTLSRTGGTVTVSGTVTGGLSLDATTGSWQLLSGTILGGTLKTSGLNFLYTQNPCSTILDGVTLDGVITVASTQLNALVIRNDLTLAQGASINGGDIAFTSTGGSISQTVQLAAGATSAGIVLAGSIYQTGTGHTVTFAPGITISGRGTIGSGIGGTWINQGRWSASNNTGTFNLAASETFQNAPGGIWDVQSGATWQFNPGMTWTNNGLVQVNGGTLNLDGNYTLAGMGFVNGVMDPNRFQRTGGIVNMYGTTINNTGSTFTLDNTTGSWQLRTSTIVGGTLKTNGANHFYSQQGSPLLDGVTLDGVLDVSLTQGNALFVRNDLTLADGATINGGDIVFTNSGGTSSQNLQLANGATSASIALGGTIYQAGTGHTVTFASGVTVSGRGTIGTGFGGTWINKGRWSSSANNSFNLAANETFQNAPGGTWDVQSGATWLFNSGTNWTNNGLMQVNGGILNLDGNYTLAGMGFVNGVMDPNRFQRTGGIVNMYGTTINNTGVTFTLDNTTGSWQLRTSTIVGGTLKTNGLNHFYSQQGSPLLDGVTLDGVLDLSLTQGNAMFVRNDLTLAQGATINGGDIVFTNNGGTSSQTVKLAVGATSAGFALAGTIYQAGTGHTVTFAPGVTVSGRGTIGTGFGGTWINQGRWSCNVNNSFNLAANEIFQNEPGGIWDVQSGGAWQFVAGSNWTNKGSIQVNGGTLNLDGNYTLDKMGFVNGVMDPNRFQRTGGIVNMYGTTITNTGVNFTLDNTTGSWQLRTSTIVGGTLKTTGANHFYSQQGSPLLDGVTLDGVLDLSLTQGNAMFIRNDLSLAQGATINGGDIAFTNSAGSSSQNLKLASGASSATIALLGNIYQAGTGHTVTFASGITVTGRGTIRPTGNRSEWHQLPRYCCW